VGKAMLAFAPGLEVQRVLARPLARYTSRTLVTAGALRTALATTRSRGTAVAMREYRVDEWALAVPVFGDRGVVAALEVSGTVSLADVKSLVPAVHYAARIFGRGLAEHPAWLPPGTGRTPLRWPIDPTLLAATDDEAYGSITVAAAGGGNRSRRESARSR
jgi:hypothetical protein